MDNIMVIKNNFSKTPFKKQTAGRMQKTASSSRFPSKFSPQKKAQTPTITRSPISAQESNLLMYSEVFLQKNELPSSPNKKARSARTKPSSSGFFYEQLLIPVINPRPNETLQDLLFKSELGVPPGDLEREAKTSLALGDRLMSLKKLKRAAKAFRKLYFASEMSQDKDGMAIGLNRLGVIYYNRGFFKTSRKMHEMHRELCEEEFIPRYNLGIIFRILGFFKYSTRELEKSVDIATEKNDNEGLFISLAQLGLTFKASGYLDKSQQYLERALALSRYFRYSDILQEVKVALAHITSQLGKTDESKHHFLSGMQNTRGKSSDLCRINIGILKAEQEFCNKYGTKL